MSYPLTVPYRLSLERFARRAGLHPQLVIRFVALGLVPAHRDRTGQLWFTPAAVLTAARVRRLHDELSLNYAAVGLVLDLLDRIEELEAALGRSERSWT